MTAPSFFRLAAIGVLAISFTLAACGRKGPLDPPPKAAVQPGAQPPLAPEAAEDEYGNPITPRGQKKPFILDWLLN